MRELCERYKEGGVALRPTAVGAAAAPPPKGKGAGAARRMARRKDRSAATGGGGGGDIRTHTTALVRCALNAMSNTDASARVTTGAGNVLFESACADVDVARALANSDSSGGVSVVEALLKLREKAVSFAAAADADPKRHPSVAFHWWEAVEGFDKVFGMVLIALMKLETLYDDGDPDHPDTELAEAFFDLVVPALLAAAASPLARERECALDSLGTCVVNVPRPKALALMVKNKANWERLVAATAGEYAGDEDISGARLVWRGTLATRLSTLRL